jgi:hypothetical protein
MCVILPLMADSALEFDGIDDHVRLSNVINIGSGSNTVEGWIKVPTIGNGNLLTDERVGVLLGNYESTPNSNWEIFSNGQLRFYWNDGEFNLLGTTDLRDGAWHQVAFVRDVSTDSIFLYVDGVIDASQAGAGTNITITTSFYIGGDRRLSETLYFHGEIDELRIWNTARTQAEICEYMCEDVTGQTGLLSYYKMTDGSGTTLSDNTGSGNSGTLTNMDNSDWVTDNQVPSGDGSTTPYQINGLNQLYWVTQNTSVWSNDFEQMSDITAKATASWDSGAGVSPIGTHSMRFSGSYNGNDHTIDGLTIERGSTNYMGLFGQINSSSTISNLHVTNATITGGQSTGALVGYVESGNVYRCSSSGTVNGSDYVGGLVGQIAGGAISESYSTATVNGTGNYVGGLNGLLAANINNCYASGSVSGGTNVGGLVGGAFGGSLQNKSYSTGSVSGSSNVGGLVGDAAPEDEMMMMPGATVTACFWDNEASGNVTSAAGTAKTTAEMKTLSTFTDAGWDFVDETVNGTDNYWGINNAEHDGYPFLSWEDFTHNYSDTPLPVTLASFEADYHLGVVDLTWISESETENLGYVLERKVNNEAWEMIASYLGNPAMIGNGTTSESHDYAWVDDNILPSCTYQYRLGDVDYNNKIVWHDVVEINVSEEASLLLAEFGLQATFPNPFNPTLTIRYGLTEDAQTLVRILNLQGKVISTLENKFQKAGSYELQWQAGDNASGVYLVEVVSGEKSDLRKVLLTK